MRNLAPLNLSPLFSILLTTLFVGCGAGAHGTASAQPEDSPRQNPTSRDGDAAGDPNFQERPANDVEDAHVEQTRPKSEANHQEKEVPLIPRKEFFGNPEKARARLSPDGSKLAFLAPVDDVLNVWVCPVDDLDAARPVTKDRHRGIRSFFWAYTNDHILYTQDEDGDEDWHVYSVNLETDEIKDLTPIDGISARVQEVSRFFPEEILVGINDRDERHFHDIHRVNIVTGERELVLQNPGFAGFLTDDQYDVRFAVTVTPDGGQLMLKPDEEEQWQEFLQIGPEDAMTSGPAGFDKSGEKMYFLDSRDRNTAALTVYDLETNEQQLLAENDQADITGAMLHPTERNVQAVTWTYKRQQWKVLDDAIADDLEYLETVADGEVQITSRTLDDHKWTVAYLLDNGPIQFYLYDREAKKAEHLFTSNPSLEDLPLVNMHPLVIQSRDGLDLVSYLSLPKGSDTKQPGRPDEPLPMVLLVHGGPWARDRWGYDPEHQLWANRGYAVLSVNFRGSTGFGKDFINAANREWAGKMHDDLIDAVNWAVEENIALPDKVAIKGASYGGYAALVGLTFTPDVFACAVDIVGPSNLVTLLDNPPPYWMPIMPVMHKRVGDNTTEEGREFLKSRSPLFFVDRIERPLLIAQGKFDPRVKQAESDQIVAAMEEQKIPVTYMLFLEEGHGFARPENRFGFYAVTEAFLAEHLGGRYEPIGDAFRNAVFQIPSGVDQVPGLQEAYEAYSSEAE